MTTELDGTAIDLDREQVAVDGTRWLWTCDVSDAGDPFMVRTDGRHRTVLPLPTVIHAHGPVIPAPEPTTAALYRQALEAA